MPFYDCSEPFCKNRERLVVTVENLNLRVYRCCENVDTRKESDMDVRKALWSLLDKAEGPEPDSVNENLFLGIGNFDLIFKYGSK
jgi:hypothetical protein